MSSAGLMVVLCVLMCACSSGYQLVLLDFTKCFAYPSAGLVLVMSL